MAQHTPLTEHAARLELAIDGVAIRRLSAWLRVLKRLAGLTGLKPVRRRLEAGRSLQLSYRPSILAGEMYTRRLCASVILTCLGRILTCLGRIPTCLAIFLACLAIFLTFLAVSPTFPTTFLTCLTIFPTCLRVFLVSFGAILVSLRGFPTCLRVFLVSLSAFLTFLEPKQACAGQKKVRHMRGLVRIVCRQVGFESGKACTLLRQAFFYRRQAGFSVGHDG